MRSTLVLFVCVLAPTTLASADVYLWSGDPNDVVTNGSNAEIFGPGTFKFEALTAPGGSTLADIGEIKVNDTVTGTVIIYVESRADNDTPGAVNVGRIKLTNAAGRVAPI